MDNEGRLFSQVAAEANVSAEAAMAACYLLNLSRKGKSLDDAAALMRKRRCDVRDVARDWGISFTDYVASPRPLALAWEKVKRGRWELRLETMVIASATADGGGAGRYTAVRAAHDLHESGSSAEVAMRRLSMELERRAVEIFGVDDVQIWIDGRAGHELLAPKGAADPGKLRSALAA